MLVEDASIGATAGDEAYLLGGVRSIAASADRIYVADFQTVNVRADDMDGRVLEELFTAEWRDGRPRETIATYDTEDWQEQNPVGSDIDDELMRRLKTLGYLD